MAMSYLQTDLAETVDHKDPEETQEVSILVILLVDKTFITVTFTITYGIIILLSLPVDQVPDMKV